MAAPEINEVRDALARMNAGEASSEVLAIIVAAAETYASMKPEWGFESLQPGLVYATTNDMLAETMVAGRPEATLLGRYAPPWAPVPVEAGDAS